MDGHEALSGADLTLAYDGRTVVHQAGIGLPAGRVVALSHEGWRKLFRSDPTVIGRRLMG